MKLHQHHWYLGACLSLDVLVSHSISSIFVLDCNLRMPVFSYSTKEKMSVFSCQNVNLKLVIVTISLCTLSLLTPKNMVFKNVITSDNFL